MAFLSTLPTFALVLLAVASFIGWFMLSALYYAINSGQLGRGRWWVLECFGEELLQSIPGGMKRKIALLKEFGYTGDLRARARETFPSASMFWLGNVTLFCFGSFVLALVVSCFVVGAVGLLIQSVLVHLNLLPKANA